MIPESNSIHERELQATLAPAETTGAAGAAPPLWLPEDLWAMKTCVPYFFTQEEDYAGGVFWSWSSRFSLLKAEVSPSPQRTAVHVQVRDTKTNQIIKRWSAQVNLTGAWRHRLRQAVGAAMILAQYRPNCRKCREPLSLCARRSDGVQIFGCSHYPECDGFINIVDFDIERKEAGSSNPPEH